MQHTCDSGDSVARSTHKTMPYRCSTCRQHFSVKTGTLMHSSKIGYRKWALAIYLMATNLKGTSSMHLHRDLGVTQKTAWFMAHRIRKTWEAGKGIFDGPVEVDEAYFGGVEKWKHRDMKRNVGGGPGGKTPVIGAKDRATNRIDARVLSHADKPSMRGSRCRGCHRRRRSSPTKRAATAGCRTTRRSITRWGSTSTARRTSTAWSRSGRCSGAATTERTTG